MNHTSRMTALLGELRRERNGAVADAMRLVGAPYGLNYGVSLPTLRRLARAEKPDYAFAKFLSLQDVRELRLAAYHIADPAGLRPANFRSGPPASSITSWPRRSPSPCCRVSETFPPCSGRGRRPVCRGRCSMQR